MERQTKFFDREILLAHGSGGKISRRLVEGLIAPIFASDELDKLGDAGSVKVGDEEVLVTTDSYVVHPIRFPGGSIGELAVNGTVNDLAVSGAEPLGITIALILEAGLKTTELRRELEAIKAAAVKVGVDIVTGDTKVVEHSKADMMFITSTGVGRRHPRANLAASRVVPGDRLLLSGPIGDHGITILLARGDLDIVADQLRSDTRAVWPMVRALLDNFGPSIKWMRDPTRGGLATTLNEFAIASQLRVVIEEEAIVVHDEVRGACEILGLDPFHIANEGQFVAVVDPECADEALALLRRIDGGDEARLIGSVEASEVPIVVCKTPYGASRVLDMLTGDPLPRIC